jgi:hypothetical protein
VHRTVLDVTDPVARVEFVPATVEVFGDQAELDDQDGGRIDRSPLPALFAPEAVKGLLVLAHDDPGVRAADGVAAIYQLCHLSHIHIIDMQ